MNIVDQQTFRDAMSCMGAAVNIITTDGPAGRAGFTASAVCSVTDTPPTLLVCLNRGASVWPVFNENRTLCVNTLSAGQEPLSNLFGGKTPMEHRFAAARWQTGVTGCPQLEEALVSFDCRISRGERRHPRHSVLCHRSDSSSRHPLRAGVVRSQLSRVDAPCLLTSLRRQLMAMFGFPHWQLKSTSTESGVVAPDERLPFAQTAVMGVQHAVAMFGATVLMPILMGLDPNLSILMSGIGTLLFFFITGGRVPSYLGSSAAFVGVVIAATGFNGQGINPNISIALGGIIACGLVYTVIGLVVMKIGTRWIERLMPPVVTGAVVMAIGLNLAPIAVKSVSASAFDSWMAVMTVLCIGLVAVFTRGMIQRLLILVGLIVACLLYGVMTNVLGLGKAVDFTLVSHAAWFGLPHFSTPAFNGQAMMLIAPVAVILVAENLGHLKAVAGMTGRNMDPYMGRAFVGDGLATMLSGSVGGSGVTTYAENIGVMAVTKVYSTLVFVAAAVIAMLLGFSPKFGALIHTIPAPVIGGASIVVFGLIAVAGARIWVQNRVDLSQNGNLIMVAVTLVLGAGDFALTLGGFTLGGIGTATFGAILLNALLSRRLVDVPPPEVVHQEP